MQSHSLALHTDSEMGLAYPMCRPAPYPFALCTRPCDLVLSFLIIRDQFGGSRIAQNTSGDADGDGVLGEVRYHERIGANDGAGPNADTAGDDCSRPDPDAVAKHWGACGHDGRPDRDAVSEVAVGTERDARVDPDAAVVRDVQPRADPGIRPEMDVDDEFQGLVGDLIGNPEESPNRGRRFKVEVLPEAVHAYGPYALCQQDDPEPLQRPLHRRSVGVVAIDIGAPALACREVCGHTSPRERRMAAARLVTVSKSLGPPEEARSTP